MGRRTAFLFGLIERYADVRGPLRLLVGFGSLGLVFAIDYATGYEVSVSLLYLIPVTLMTWSGGWRLGTTCALLAAIGSTLLNSLDPTSHAKLQVAVLQGCSQGGILIVVMFLTLRIRTLSIRERLAARIDFLAGTTRRRSFYEALANETARARRIGRPFSIVFIELTQPGGSSAERVGGVEDRLLYTYGAAIVASTRSTDVVTLLERGAFAVLLPVCSQTLAKEMVENLRQEFADSQREPESRATYAMGVLTCRTGKVRIEDIVKMAETLLRRAKAAGDDAVCYGFDRSS